MTTFFLTDANGTKHSVNEQQLQTLAAQGKITPNTPLETDDGHKGLAGQIPGLNFPVAAPTPFAQPAPQRTEQTTYSSPPRQFAMYSQTNESTGMFWLFDFAFRDLRLPVINLWACRILYAICFFGAILWGIVMTFVLLFTVIPYDATAIIAIPLVWLVPPLFIFFVRLFCEWYIIIFDWVVETTKAARKYTDE